MQTVEGRIGISVRKDREEFAAWELSRHRSEVGVSQRQLSGYLGVSVAAVRRWEKEGCRENVADDKVARFLRGDFDRELRSINILPSGIERRFASCRINDLQFLRCIPVIVRRRENGRICEELACRFNEAVNRCLDELLRYRWQKE